MAQLLVVIVDDTNKVPALLEAWQAVGVPGSTILNGVGGYRTKNWLQQVGLGSITEFIARKENETKLILSVIEDEETLQKTIEVTEMVVGDFSTPDTGLFFVVPLSYAKGIVNQIPPEEVESNIATVKKKVSNQLDDVELITRNSSVSEVNEFLNLKPTLVQLEDSLLEVAEAMLKNPVVTVASVVNKKDELQGILPLRNLADDLFMSVVPEEFFEETRNLEDALRFAKLSQTNLASDAMLPPVSIKKDDLVRDAFREMHDNKLSGIPIINHQNKVIGYINLLELLALYARSQKISNEEGE